MLNKNSKKMISIKYLTKTIIACTYYMNHCRLEAKNLKDSGNEDAAIEWNDLADTYEEMISTYQIKLDHLKQAGDEQ